MGCLLILFSLITPRLVIVLMWIFTNYLSRAYGSWFWATVGFFVAPTTVLAYAIAKNQFTTPGGGISAAGVLIIVLGVVIDAGLLGGSARSRRR